MRSAIRVRFRRLNEPACLPTGIEDGQFSLRLNWWRVLGTAARSHIDQGIRQ
jgi:hypothetical protein